MSVFAPGACRICEDPLLRATRLPICNDCLADVAPQRMTLCRRCGESLGMESRDPGFLCFPCESAPPAFLEARSFGEFSGNLRSLVHLMKFESMPHLAEYLASRLAETMLDLRDAPMDMLVLPVPLFRGKRSFNQSERLAAAALKTIRRNRRDLRWTMNTAALARIRETRSQYGLSRRQRRINLRNAFAVQDTSAITGRDILLIDDVYTTGATARECTRTLLKAGAASVRIVTLARAQRNAAMLWSPARNSAMSNLSSHPPSPPPTI